MPISKSTREFWQEAGKLKNYSLFERLHGYFYMRWPYLYIATGSASNSLGKFGKKVLAGFSRVFPARPPKPGQITFADTYHGKVVPLRTARELVSVNQNIEIKDLEHVIPYALARALILNHPDHLVALDCPCRSAREHPCLPIDVCLIVGEPFASFTLEHHSQKSRAITPAEAVAILEAEEERGHVHHAFFKEAVLQRFYAICNCCSCCCAAIRSHQNGTPMLASSGYLARVDGTLCQGCGVCVETCHFGALAVEDGLNKVNESLCMGCGVCTSHCVLQAITLELAPEKGLPLEMSDILEKALQVD